MQLRIWLCFDLEYVEDSLQNHLYRTMSGSARAGSLPLTVPNANAKKSCRSICRYTVLHRCGGGSVVLSPSRLSFLALSPSRLSPLARSPSRYSSGFSERDVVLSALLSEFRGCMETTW